MLIAKDQFKKFILDSGLVSRADFELAEKEAAKKDIKILNLKRAGEIAPYKIRVRVDFIIL